LLYDATFNSKKDVGSPRLLGTLQIMSFRERTSTVRSLAKTSSTSKGPFLGDLLRWKPKLPRASPLAVSFLEQSSPLRSSNWCPPQPHSRACGDRDPQKQNLSSAPCLPSFLRWGVWVLPHPVTDSEKETHPQLNNKKYTCAIDSELSLSAIEYQMIPLDINVNICELT